MKLYLICVTLAVFSFSAMSGAVIASLHDMEFIRYQAAHLITLSIEQLAQESI